ncbi:NAC domain-containing protein 53-like isoform X2 [Solanum dulcamara]|uniref:NAC domain-containing protein 53-like isoform X2 n=1 Tax=Solanum dulcamara TaxID=45834 RepID=UPI0024851CC7|nr:NAC domain-containing protein 53-like isoform X2 [Solanum dulcamara]
MVTLTNPTTDPFLYIKLFFFFTSRVVVKQILSDKSFITQIEIVERESHQEREVDRSASFSSFDLFHCLSTMRPLSPSAPPQVLISSCGTNDDIFLTLDQINRGSSIPDDLIVDNPYQYDPLNVPVGSWFLVGKTEEKETKHGLWRVKYPARQIFANSAISGWRTTFEFFQVQATIEEKTGWIMHEYKVTPNGKHDQTQTKSQESAICRLFSLSNDPEQNDDLGVEYLLRSFSSVNPDTSRNNGQRSISEPQFYQLNRQTEGTGSSLVVKSRDQSVDDKVAEKDCILRGDYLELDDLADAASHSSSSENSSRQSFESDGFFDSLALLADLDDEKKEELIGKGSTINHSIMMCEIGNDVLVQPAPLGFLVKGSDAGAKETQQVPDNNKSISLSEPSPDQAAKKLKTDRMDEGPSHACRAMTSSSSNGDEPGRAARREEKRTKKPMKFLCFMPF